MLQDAIVRTDWRLREVTTQQYTYTPPSTPNTNTGKIPHETTITKVSTATNTSTTTEKVSNQGVSTFANTNNSKYKPLTYNNPKKPTTHENNNTVCNNTHTPQKTMSRRANIIEQIAPGASTSTVADTHK